MLHFLVPLAIGAGAGLMGGVFGVSGGTVAISAMALLGFKQQLAQGTSMVMQLPNLALGAYQYTRRGSVNVPAALTMSAVALPFTFAGAFIATHIPSHDLRIAFSVLFLLHRVVLDVECASQEEAALEPSAALVLSQCARRDRRNRNGNVRHRRSGTRRAVAGRVLRAYANGRAGHVDLSFASLDDHQHFDVRANATTSIGLPEFCSQSAARCSSTPASRSRTNCPKKTLRVAFSCFIYSMATLLLIVGH